MVMNKEPMYLFHRGPGRGERGEGLVLLSIETKLIVGVS